MKVYDRVKNILERDERYRNSDKKLYWRVCIETGCATGNTMYLDGFMRAPSFETVRRSRQDIQKRFPHLQATSNKVRQARGQKEKTKGTFMYREEDNGQHYF